MRLVITFETFAFSGFEKSVVPSSGTLVNFPAGQGTFHSYFSSGQGGTQASCLVTKQKIKANFNLH